MRDVGPYKVIFSSDAWKKVGLIPGGTFLLLQQALERIANEMGSRRPEGEDSSSELRTNVQGLTIRYQRDDAARTLTLVDIIQAPKEPPVR
jgi:hypothetical protein